MTMNIVRKIFLAIPVIFLFTDLQSQNWSTFNGNSARTGNSEITGPSDVSAPWWQVTDAVYTVLGENVYTFGDLLVTSRCSANFADVIIECRNLQNGDLVWTSPFIANGSKLYCMGISEDAVYACDYSTDSVYALNISDGSLKWTGELTSYSYGARESVIYACNGDIILNGPVTGEASTMRLDKNTGKVVWTDQELYAVSPVVPLAATTSTVYRITGAINQPIRLAALDAETGTLLYYSDPLPGDGDQENFLALGNDGRIYFWRDNGLLYSFTDDGSGFTENWIYSSPSPPVGASNSRISAGLNQDIYAFDQGKVIRLSYSDGSLLNTSLVDVTGGNITVGADSTVYVSNEEGTVYAFTPDLQEVIWQYNVSMNVFGNPILAKDGIMVLTGAGTTITAFRPEISLKPVADFRASARRIPVGDPVDFFDQSSYLPDTWQWTFAGAVTPSSNVRNPAGIIYDTPGIYEVTLTAGNSNGNDEVIKSCYIEVYEPGVGISPLTASENAIRLYPNPATDLIRITTTADLSGSPYSLTDQLGRVVLTGVIAGETTTADISGLNSGLYLVQVAGTGRGARFIRK
jgi:outer membrane protein assembly factor BamB